jgi:hypothetical protein
MNTMIKLVIKNVPEKKTPGADYYTTEFYPTFKQELRPIFFELLFKN